MQTGKRTELLCAGNSHQGLVRNNNEDLFFGDSESGIFIVIDGVGGHSAGEKAAEIALRILRSRLERTVGSTEERVREAITLANNEIYKQAQENSEWSGMSCVLTVAVVENDAVTIGHVGDTRLYQFHGGCLKQLTHDHSFVGELVANGFIDEQEALSHPRRNEIVRDVGSNPHQPEDPDFIEISKHPFLLNSALLLCSDGLSDSVSPDLILSVVTDFFEDPSQVVNRLIDAANAAGGKDNTTVVYIVDASANVAEEVQEERIVEAASAQLHTDKHSRFISALCSRVACVLYGFLMAFILGSLLLWQVHHLEIQRAAIEKSKHILIVDPRDPRTYLSVSEALRRAQTGDIVEVAPEEYQKRIVEKQVFEKK